MCRNSIMLPELEPINTRQNTKLLRIQRTCKHHTEDAGSAPGPTEPAPSGPLSALTAVGEPGEGLLSDWLQGAAGGVAWRGRGLPAVLLPFRQQVADLLLQLRTHFVLGQNKNPKAGGIVLHHVQEHLQHRTRTGAVSLLRKRSKNMVRSCSC